MKCPQANSGLAADIRLRIPAGGGETACPRLERCLLVDDADLNSADDFVKLSCGLGRHVSAVLMRRVNDAAIKVLARPGRNVAGNLADRLARAPDTGAGRPHRRTSSVR